MYLWSCSFHRIYAENSLPPDMEWRDWDCSEKCNEIFFCPDRHRTSQGRQNEKLTSTTFQIIGFPLWPSADSIIIINDRRGGKDFPVKRSRRSTFSLPLSSEAEPGRYHHTCFKSPFNHFYKHSFESSSRMTLLNFHSSPYLSYIPYHWLQLQLCVLYSNSCSLVVVGASGNSKERRKILISFLFSSKSVRRKSDTRWWLLINDFAKLT